MANIWISSDPHFGHAKMLTFRLADGTPMRSFSCVEEMDEHMIDRHNALVRPGDKWYCLGDVAMHRHHVATVKRLAGKKRLVRGNHDEFAMKYYVEAGFEEIYATRTIYDILMSHIPLHPNSIRGTVTNVHGHVHNNVGPLHFGPHYFNVSMEVIDYTPVSLEDLRVRIRRQQEEWMWNYERYNEN